MFRRAVALALSTHPGPTLAVTTVVVLLGVAVGLESWRIVLLGIAMLFNQLSVGLSNDWIDADRDRAVGRTDKPVATGAISVGVVRSSAFLCAGLALVATAPLGLAAETAQVVALASAWSYNAGLKSTPFSVVPYLVTFGLLPALASTAKPVPSAPVWWAVAAGALLGVAAHFANVLPDLDDDRVTGIRGLPHRVGLRGSIIVTWVALAAGSAAIAIGTGGDRIALAGFGVSLLIATIGMLRALRRGVGRWLFQLVILAALVDVAMLVLAGSRLLA
jgi:4-hydroxybenzoate polyprenyltransferase